MSSSCYFPVVQETPPTPSTPTSYTITTTSSASGCITSSQTISSGQSVTLTATAEEHFQFTQWTGDCGPFPSDATTIR
ncbi:MAG: hypothetical protein OXE77_04295 [Flavobacteriaceae bacterium]|nr:hypothetical protein [Flavobacteriaceae bacterium]MCY4266272.1 hypothetical protein [Flavobacteriaceae bacterium]MCY4299504.1 hypothetical protein [Flavobacteriaceae bacterium]